MKEMKSVGNCYYCQEPVLAGEGQAIKWIKKMKFGKLEEAPLHKRCRKLNKEK